MAGGDEDNSPDNARDDDELANKLARLTEEQQALYRNQVDNNFDLNGKVSRQYQHKLADSLLKNLTPGQLSIELKEHNRQEYQYHYWRDRPAAGKHAIQAAPPVQEPASLERAGAKQIPAPQSAPAIRSKASCPAARHAITASCNARMSRSRDNRNKAAATPRPKPPYTPPNLRQPCCPKSQPYNYARALSRKYAAKPIFPPRNPRSMNVPRSPTCKMPIGQSSNKHTAPNRTCSSRTSAICSITSTSPSRPACKPNGSPCISRRKTRLTPPSTATTPAWPFGPRVSPMNNGKISGAGRDRVQDAVRDGEAAHHQQQANAQEAARTGGVLSSEQRANPSPEARQTMERQERATAREAGKGSKDQKAQEGNANTGKSPGGGRSR